MSAHGRIAVLFDLDGTLVDSIDLLVASMEYAFSDRVRRPPVSEWKAGIGTPLDSMIRPWAEDEADVVFLRERYREYQIANHDARTSAYPGVVETVSRRAVGWRRNRSVALRMSSKAAWMLG